MIRQSDTEILEYLESVVLGFGGINAQISVEETTTGYLVQVGNARFTGRDLVDCVKNLARYLQQVEKDLSAYSRRLAGFSLLVEHGRTAKEQDAEEDR